jgi:hypothetical protein
MKSTYMAKAGALAYTAFSAAQNWASSLSESFIHPSIPGYLAEKGQYGAKIGAVAAASLAVDRVSSSLEDLLPGGKHIRGALPLAAATLGVGAMINHFGSYIGIEEGYGVMTTTKALMTHYHDNAMALVTGQEPNAWYATGACITAASAIRAGANILTRASRYADRKEAERIAEKKK